LLIPYIVTTLQLYEIHLHTILSKQINIALVGNPNCGKSSLFNCLTGLKQKVGNFPGVTVDKLSGNCSINESIKAIITDLPGTYSLYPKRTDEWVVYKVLLGLDDDVKPDLIVLIADASNLKRNLLFCSQIIDLKIPVVIGLSMMDIAKSKGIKIDIPTLERELGVPIIAINPRKNIGIAALKKAITLIDARLYQMPVNDFIDMETLGGKATSLVKEKYNTGNNYKAVHLLMHHQELFEELDNKKFFLQLEKDYPFTKTKIQAAEIIQRYAKIKQVMQQAVVEADPLQKSLFTQKLDSLLLHRIWGYFILLGVLLLLFQSVFWLAQYPMDWVDTGFAHLNGWLSNVLPHHKLTDLLINGVLAGLSGIFVFVPQIMILFAFITLLEDTGYMARVSFLSDRLMRSVGLNGKSVVPMISGFACAVPAIMSARNIENKKERLLTILVTPLMSCSARLPVYSVLIALVIPNHYVGGIFNVQGLFMLGLYLLGVVLALFFSYLFSFFINIKERSFFLLELPIYRAPRWGNIINTMLNKAKMFVFEAGKVILIISILLWFLSSYGPSKKMQKVSDKYAILYNEQPPLKDSLQKMENGEKLENSYAGILGKLIEPAIKPLGYDWRIGIALITSFAAREVFVGTMATLYSVGNDDEQENKLTQKMAQAKLENGKPVYTVASGVSLMIFYALAMQCMSTLAIVKRETKSWKWPIIQFTYMTILAYLLSWLAFSILK
jgi:ferrous iron transport protein B